VFWDATLTGGASLLLTTFHPTPMATSRPDIKTHPNQESKSGKPPYASPSKRNFSANDPTREQVVGGVEEKFRDAIEKKVKKEKGHGKGKVPGKRRSNPNR
jgi:hypothetical protein